MTTAALAVPRALRVSVTRAAGLVLLAYLLAELHLPLRPPTLCLLRAATGLPCPLCGSTTAAVELGGAEPVRAFMASPVAVLGALALVLRPVVGSRLPRLSSRAALWTLIAAGAAASELWQLHRFGFV